MTHSNALLFHSKNSPKLNKFTMRIKKHLRDIEWNFLITTGSTNTNSTSKITNTTAKTKNRSENACRDSPLVAKPHSSGARNSRDILENFATITPINKKAPPKSTASVSITHHNQINISIGRNSFVPKKLRTFAPLACVGRRQFTHSSGARV